MLTLLSLNVNAEALSCKDLFADKEYDVKEFVINLNGKKESTRLLNIAHVNLISNADVIELKTALLTIADSGLTELTREQVVMINKFRQDTSFMRSVFQTNSKEHISPRKYATFVRDFGHLKDMVNINEGAQAKDAAQKLLLKFAQLDLDTLLKDIKPASKKSVKKYFKAVIKNTRRIMKKYSMEVDELHDVRKNMRDILRFMQAQNELNGDGKINLSAGERSDDTAQIDFLKKLNRKLGEVCDDYAAQIIRGEITDTTLVEFPEKMRSRVEWFLERYRFEE
ncbi:hypothetical protein CIK05_06925 [Bdellovibrio sp. qaytius]|nr:hypothetical protein CIK05_06925 [Bdellovibrio sp. qaytius]